MTLAGKIGTEVAESAYSMLRLMRKNPELGKSTAKTTEKLMESAADTVDFQKLIGSVDDTKVEKGFEALGSVMASVPKRISDAAKAFVLRVGTTAAEANPQKAFQEARKNFKISVQANPVAQEWLRNVKSTLDHPDVKGLIDELGKLSDYKKMFNVNSYEEFVAKLASNNPEYQKLALQSKAIAEVPPAEHLKNSVNYFIKK